MSNVTSHLDPWQCLHGAHGVQGLHSLKDGIILFCRKAYPNVGDLPGHVGPWKSIEGEQRIHRELGMRQAIYAPVSEGPNWATFTAGMKAKILQSNLSTW